MRTELDDPGSSWIARPWATWSIRVVVALAPLAIAILIAWGLGSVVPRAGSFMLGIVRWFLIAVVSTFVLIAVDKAARRLLPLATLFGLTLAFPDQAPSRFQLALRRGSTAQLRIRIAEARAGTLSDTPEDAAERVLELVMALSLHDRLTRGHSERVRAYSQMIGEELGLTATELDRLRWAGLLHDIGKLMVSGEILNKPGQLTEAEFDTIKRHPEFGRGLVAPLVDWLGEAARAVWEHHERWDGNGYPQGLAGTDISLAGRIVSVVDAYDVMTSARSYKKAISPAAARAELARCSGTHFDPIVVRAFMNVSLGRLRFAAGPLTWLAQVPMFPTAIGATATQGAATATAALVGAAATSMGLGLTGEPILPVPRSVVAEATSALPEQEGVDVGGPRSGAASAPTIDAPRADAGDPGRSDGAPGSGADATVRVPASTATSTLAVPSPDSPGRDPSPTTTAVATTLAPPTPTSTVRSTATTSTSTPTAGPTAASTTTAIATTTTASAATTGAPTTTSTTTSIATTTTASTATTGAPTTTVPERPMWLPAPGVATAYFLELPDTVDLASSPVLGLKTTTPTRGGLSGFDPDNDGRAGLTLDRTVGVEPPAAGRVVFAWGGPTSVHTAGPTSADLHVTIDSLLPGSIAVRGRLMVCNAASVCAVIDEAHVETLAALIAFPVTLDFGTIDVWIPANGTLRLALDVPSSSAAGVVLVADTRSAPSAITLTFP